MKDNTTVDFLSIITLGAARAVAEGLIAQNASGGLQSVTVREAGSKYYLVFNTKGGGKFETPLPDLMTVDQQNYLINMINKLVDDSNKLKFNGNQVLDTSNFIDELLKVCDSNKIIRKDGLITIKLDGIIDDENISKDKSYSSKKIDDNFAKKADVLTKTNTEVYTPTGNYMPATKKYVDDAIKSLNDMHIMGRVDTVKDLPPTAQEQEVWCVGPEGSKSLETWVKLQDGNWLQIGTTDITFDNYYNKDEINALMKKKISTYQTLPTPSDEYLDEVALDLSNKNIYRCTKEDETYKWQLIINHTHPKEVVISNSEPDDKNSVWIDNADKNKVVIKVFNEDTNVWEKINNIPEKILIGVEYKDDMLKFSYSDNTKQEIEIKAGTSSANIKASLINGNIIVNGKELKVYDESDTMKKSVYASDKNEHSVKSADVAERIKAFEDNFDPNVYYGRNEDGIEGLFPFPIGTKDESKMQIREFDNVVVGWEKVIPSLVVLDDKVMVSVLRLIEQEDNVDVPLKSFDIVSDKSVNCTDNVEIDNGTHIKKLHPLKSSINDDGLYEADLSEFMLIEGVKING